MSPVHCLLLNVRSISVAFSLQYKQVGLRQRFIPLFQSHCRRFLSHPYKFNPASLYYFTKAFPLALPSMADPGGLVIGVVGLGALYSTCVECFSVFRKIRAFDRDYDFLASRLWTEQALLMRWGQRMGLLTGKMRDIDPQLQDPYTKEAVAGVLYCIEILLTDTKKFQTTYGLVPQQPSGKAADAVSSNNKKVRHYSHSQVWLSDSIVPERKQVNLVRKFHWSILDKEKFRDLIDELRELVQRLEELAPAPESQVAEGGVSPRPRSRDRDERRGRRRPDHRESAREVEYDVWERERPSAIMPAKVSSSRQALITQPKSRVKEIAQQHSREIWCDEEPGSYTTYRYYKIT
jgi:hypothetical protein